MGRALIRQPLFIIGTSVILVLLIGSFVTGFIYHGHVPHLSTQYKNGNLVGAIPFTPSQVPPWGTDSAGNKLFQEILMGAKYTIGIAAVVAVLRVFFSLILGLFFQRYLMKASFYFSGLFDSFSYVPVTLICAIILSGVLFSVTDVNHNHIFTTTYTQRVIFELIILAIVSIPGLTLFFANEADRIYQQEFIRSVELLGGSRWYVVRKHITPLLGPKLILTFIEQMVQTLVVLIHLGLFKLLFGGTYVFALVTGASERYQSLSGEWSGVIGSSYDYLFIFPRIILIPLVAFAVLIISLNLILDGLKRAFENRNRYVKSQGRSRKRKQDSPYGISEDSFKPAHKSA